MLYSISEKKFKYFRADVGKNIKKNFGLKKNTKPARYIRVELEGSNLSPYVKIVRHG